MADVDIRLHHSVIADLLYAPTGAVHQLVASTTRLVSGAVKIECPVDTGDLLASIASEVHAQPPRRVVGRVLSNDPAAWWVNRGTGQYALDPGFHNQGIASAVGFADRGAGGAPRAAKKASRKQQRTRQRAAVRPDVIRPRRASALRFFGKRDGQLLFRAWVRGQEPNEFMWRGLKRGTRVGRQEWTLNRRRGTNEPI